MTCPWNTSAPHALVVPRHNPSRLLDADMNQSIRLKRNVLLRDPLASMTQVQHVVPMIQVCKFDQWEHHAPHQQFVRFQQQVTPSPYVHAASTKRKQLQITSKTVCQSL